MKLRTVSLKYLHFCHDNLQSDYYERSNYSSDYDINHFYAARKPYKLIVCVLHFLHSIIQILLKNEKMVLINDQTISRLPRWNV